jgi:hypothetical protein
VLSSAAHLRLCVDLNIWYAWYLAGANGRNGTVIQKIVEIVQDGRSTAGPVQLIVSHTMLSRMMDVLVRKGASAESAHRFTRLISNIAALGPCLEYPHVILGGGFEPTREAISQSYDPYDPNHMPLRIDNEDGRVLDTAIGGHAHALVTNNFKDFRYHQDSIIESSSIRIRRTAGGYLYVLKPAPMLDWLRTGIAPVVAGTVAEQDFRSAPV